MCVFVACAVPERYLRIHNFKETDLKKKPSERFGGSQEKIVDKAFLEFVSTFMLIITIETSKRIILSPGLLEAIFSDSFGVLNRTG